VTQISLLPQIDGARTAFAFVKNAAFTYSFVIAAPSGPQVPLVATASTTAGSATLSNLPAVTVTSLVTGQKVSGYGIPAGATITAIPSTTSVTLSANVTQTAAANSITFQVMPLDLTGISFRQQIRATASDTGVLLEMSTDNGLLINGGTTGVLSAYVPASSLGALPETTGGSALVTDIVATAADGGPINLMALSGPASVTVTAGVTR
jgi:hypothetical protein